MGQHQNDSTKIQRSRTISRRDLLRGRLWRLASPQSPIGLLERYPKSNSLPNPETRPAQSGAAVQSIAGISIEPIFTADVRPRQAISIPIFRPPGAIEETQFLAACTKCGDCQGACPHSAIRLATSRHNIVAGTPTIHADISACQCCQDFPCISACETGALTNQIPAIIGTAIIKPHLCLAHQGTACSLCSQQCPVAGAIAIVGGAPLVQESSCTGCGVCRKVCPAPENAVLLMPLLSRPSRPKQSDTSDFHSQ